MRISDWSSDVCSSDLAHLVGIEPLQRRELGRVPAQDIAVARIAAHEVLMARLGAIKAFIRFARHDDRLGEIFAAPDLRPIGVRDLPLVRVHQQLERARCRESVCPYVYISRVSVSLKKTK